MRVTAFCQNSSCNHNQQLDLKALSARFGPDTPAMHDHLAPRLKCTKCGGRQIGLTYTPTVRPTGNPYLTKKNGR
jgi:ribosomal protein L33